MNYPILVKFLCPYCEEWRDAEVDIVLYPNSLTPYEEFILCLLLLDSRDTLRLNLAAFRRARLGPVGELGTNMPVTSTALGRPSAFTSPACDTEGARSYVPELRGILMLPSQPGNATRALPTARGAMHPILGGMGKLVCPCRTFSRASWRLPPLVVFATLLGCTQRHGGRGRRGDGWVVLDVTAGGDSLQCGLRWAIGYPDASARLVNRSYRVPRDGLLSSHFKGCGHEQRGARFLG